jgi:hypothetical protein
MSCGKIIKGNNKVTIRNTSFCQFIRFGFNRRLSYQGSTLFCVLRGSSCSLCLKKVAKVTKEQRILQVAFMDSMRCYRKIIR